MVILRDARARPRLHRRPLSVRLPDHLRSSLPVDESRRTRTSGTTGIVRFWGANPWLEVHCAVGRHRGGRQSVFGYGPIDHFDDRARLDEHIDILQGHIRREGVSTVVLEDATSKRTGLPIGHVQNPATSQDLDQRCVDEIHPDAGRS
jgi:hypothetical protein